MIVTLAAMSGAPSAPAADSGPTFGARFGVTWLSVAKDFNPYLSGGATYGANLGWAFSRNVALMANYEWASVGTDVRNRGAGHGGSHYLAGGGRIGTTDGGAGLYFETLIGLRTISYSFFRDDGFQADAWDLPRGPGVERASLRGWELRLAMGLSAPITRKIWFDGFAAFGLGKMLHYSDTLDCATFAPGPCGSYKFESHTFGLYSALRYN